MADNDDLIVLDDENDLPLRLIGERRGMDGVNPVGRRLAALDPDDGIAL